MEEIARRLLGGCTVLLPYSTMSEAHCAPARMVKSADTADLKSSMSQSRHRLNY